MATVGYMFEVSMIDCGSSFPFDMGESREESDLRLRSCRSLNFGIALVSGQNAGMDAAFLDDKIRVTGLQ